LAFRQSLSVAAALIFSVTIQTLHAEEPVSSTPPAAPAEHPGKLIYEKHCVECHGANGEGVEDEYDDPLYGNRSLASLAKRIDKTMPEDNEELLDAEQSAQVADYIYHAFYSAEARSGGKPLKPDFVRLTSNQFRNSIADIFGHFQKEPDQIVEKERGLLGKYRAKGVITPEGFQPEGDSSFQRKDARIAFQFGEGSPDKFLNSQNFFIRWEGSVIAEETGNYEFVVKTQNGARFFINDLQNPLIDGSVSSGLEPREEKGTIFLLGGRPYPIRLEYRKSTEPSASIELMWKIPNGVLETVPSSHLSPVQTRATVIVSNPFPADDSSDGYPRGTSISKAWFDAVTEAAITTSEYAAENLDRFAGTKPDDAERPAKLKAFAREFASVALRRPLSNEDAAAFIEPHFANGNYPEIGVKRVILATLTSPKFLYPALSERETPDDYDVAARLALAMWDSVPDQELRQQVAAGGFKTPEQIRRQADRMLWNPRSREKLHGFFHHWLQIKDITAIAKDPAVYPDLNEAVLSDLRRSLGVFIDGIVWDGRGDYRELLSANYMILNDRLAKFYQKEPVGEEFRRVDLPDSQRAGVLTHPYLLTSFSYFKDTSPIHRGVFLTRSIVGRALKPPPEAVEFKDGHFDPSLTMREKVTDVTKSAACMGCHSEINPLGFALESYDAVGRWRTMDNNKPVNTVSDFPDDNGGTVRIATARDIAEFAIQSESSKKTFIRQLFNHTVKQPAEVYGKQTLDRLTKKFSATDFNIRELLLESAVISATAGTSASETSKETASN
jgi:mono/diheme cytochrome c family protein